MKRLIKYKEDVLATVTVRCFLLGLFKFVSFLFDSLELMGSNTFV